MYKAFFGLQEKPFGKTPDPRFLFLGRAHEEAVMKGYVVVFEGDADTAFSAYSPGVPGVVAAGETREETQALMVEAMSAHLALLGELGEEVPEPVEAGEATILAIPAA